MISVINVSGRSECNSTRRRTILAYSSMLRDSLLYILSEWEPLSPQYSTCGPSEYAEMYEREHTLMKAAQFLIFVGDSHALQVTVAANGLEVTTDKQ